MKYEKILFPEVLLGLRGSKDFSKILSAVCSSLKQSSDGKGDAVFDTSHFKETSIRMAATHYYKNCAGPHDILSFQKFKESTTKNIYYVPPKFREALGSIKKGVPAKVLPKEFSAYFILKDCVDASGTSLEGAFVYIGYAGGGFIFL